MNTAEALTILQSRDFLDKLYNFSYHRCDSSHEAEDLCSDIILSVLSAVQKQEEIDSFYAFVWAIARRVYADYSEKRNKTRQILSLENTDFSLASRANDLDDLIERDADLKMLQSIFKEIAFLSKAYRDVMILYYLDGYSVREIAKRLNIEENTVKQRLFSARQSIRKEVESMNETMNERSYLLKPVRLAFSGTGAPNGNDPKDKVERLFSQNLIYLCKDKPRNARELSDMLCVPMPYIEEELNIQCRGENGSYGILRRLDTGKYALNIPLVDYAEYEAANRIYKQYIPEFCENFKKTLELKKDELLSFPYLSKQKDTGLLMWTILSRIC
ncbi:MAG: sigma-70 family RNA polymerase sigma factor [Lachnospiraceae bacterium]|nr:sigma-70 family RNA polymerase sigma factor [Lachnospiraceae bacterium]